MALPGWWSKLGLAAGVVASLSLAEVGIYPMNKLDPHVLAALTYFRSGLATELLFGLAILFQPKGRVVLDRRANLAGLLAVICYSAFIIFMQMTIAQGANPLDISWQARRPHIMPLALLEWAVFFSILVWFGLIAAAGRKRVRKFIHSK